MRSRPLLCLFFASILMLSACGTDDAAKKDDAKTETKEDKIQPIKTAKVLDVSPICPQVAIVRGLDVVRDYGNEMPDPAQLVAAGKMLKIDGDCEYRDNGIDIAFNIDMAAKRGPRLGGNHVSFPIFVAVADPSGNVLNKDQMTSDVKFSGDETVANHAEALHVFIPLAKAEKMNGPSYKVLSGFQLTPAQAEQAKAALKP